MLHERSIEFGKGSLIPSFFIDGVSTDRSIEFWDRIADRYSKQPIVDEAANQKRLKVTREYFRSDMAVLEFGCGTGSTAIAHAPYVKHIEAINISSKMIEIARRKAKAEKIENVTFTQSSTDEFSTADQSLDAVLGLSILHLLDDKETVIAKVYKMLKPGGVSVTSTACIGDTMQRQSGVHCGEAIGDIQRSERTSPFFALMAGPRPAHEKRGRLAEVAPRKVHR